MTLAASVDRRADLVAIVAMAMQVNDHLGTLASDEARKAFIRELFGAAEVVWVFWQDPSDPSHFTGQIVKGLQKQGRVASQAAFIVGGEADAAGIYNEWGDGAVMATHEMTAH